MNASLRKRIAHLWLVVCLVVLQGCSEERPFIPPPSAEYVVILNEQGKPENILIDQFFKQKEHASEVKVMVLDKKNKARKLITPAELLAQNPNAGPYLIFKHDDPLRPFDDLPR